ncbi:hypothetical protein [Tenuifilum thalassicum]|uniref:Uncharacterized protein n=1 Tax=Tenuifilum thalassicum TaxID=2590900 RepID=A0A7D3XUR2_9BACT|nr:hypothetical protein [Tenuifilum thalassicum]QKG79651.1 hypothetical protein FHG85_05040 [Tenuifilum thalassicum]
MDAGDFIYILIAIGLAILNAVGNANKKKKQAEQKRQSQAYSSAQKTFEEKDSSEVNDDLLKKLQELVGEDISYNQTEDEYVESQQENVTETYQEYGSPEQQYDDVNEPIADIPVSEEQLYPTHDSEILDVQQPEKYEPIDVPVSEVEGQIGEFDYQESTKAEEERLKSQEIGADNEIKEEEKKSILADFDARKAVVYAEIIKPKYF